MPTVASNQLPWLKVLTYQIVSIGRYLSRSVLMTWDRASGRGRRAPTKNQCREAAYLSRCISRVFSSCSRPLACTEQSECALRACQRQDRRDRARPALARPSPHSLHLNYLNDCVIISRALISSPQGGYMVQRCSGLYSQRASPTLHSQSSNQRHGD